MIRIGLTGAQGTGKTTLAKAFCDVSRCSYLNTSLASVFMELNTTIEVVNQSDIKYRLKVQEKMVDHLLEIMRLAPRDFIADRTFIDIAAYTLSFIPYDLEPNSFTAERVKQIVDRCLRLQRRFFDKTLILQPGITLSDADHQRKNRGSLSWIATGRINSYTHTLAANVADTTDCAFVPSEITDLQDRLVMLKKFSGLFDAIAPLEL